MLPEGEAKPNGSGNAPAKFDCPRAAMTFGADCPTFAGGTTADGRVIEPVVSCEGTAAAAGSGAERDVQPDKSTQAETIADKMNERMRTRTQDNRPWRRANDRAGANY